MTHLPASPAFKDASGVIADRFRHGDKPGELNGDKDAEWVQPEVWKVYQNWMQDHHGVIDMELLCTAMFNAGARNAIFTMTKFSGVVADVARVESRVVGLHALLESITRENP
jgi:hypothetical protein